MSETFPPIPSQEAGHVFGGNNIDRVHPIPHDEMRRPESVSKTFEEMQATEYSGNMLFDYGVDFEESATKWAYAGMDARTIVEHFQQVNVGMMALRDIKNFYGWAEQIVAQAAGEPVPVQPPESREISTELDVPPGTPLVEHDGERYRIISYEERIHRKMGQSILNEEMNNG